MKHKITLTLILAAMICTGCTRKITQDIYREHPVMVHDTIMRVKVRTDSIYLRDSIYSDGPVLIKERWRYRTVTAHDTIYVTRTDTVNITQTVTRTVDAPSSSRSYILWALIAFAAIFLTTKIIQRK